MQVTAILTANVDIGVHHLGTDGLSSLVMIVDGLVPLVLLDGQGTAVDSFVRSWRVTSNMVGCSAV